VRTPYTTTAPKTAAATPLPSLGSSDEPMTMWWPLANMLPMVLRIMMAKMEMTTLLVGRLVSGGSFLSVYPYYFLPNRILLAAFSGSDVPCPCVEGGDDGLHYGGGVKDTELVLGLMAALSGAVRAGCDCGGGD
jgi:hypothetical protein